ncbi:Universal stress protein [Actinosynnema sp. ALI-1.44]
MATVVERPVVVGVDGSTSAAQAVRWAAREAVRRGAPLVLMHTTPMVPVTVPHAVALGPYRNALADQGRQWLAEATATAREAALDVVVSAELTGGWAAEQLIGRSASAELVVLGSRGLGGFTGLVVGSIAVAVTAHGHCPVVVVRGPDARTGPRQDGPVVVGVDGSPTGQAAIPFAFRAAASRNAPLVAVHAWSDVPTTAWDLLYDWPTIQEQQYKALTERLAEYQAQYPTVPVEQVVVCDRPVHTLLDQAENAQLVVVGSRGRGGFRGLLLGSTGQALIHHATCPVAIVPPPRP